MTAWIKPGVLEVWRLEASSKFSPIVDRLTTDQKIWLASHVTDFENFGKSIEGEAHNQAHWAVARANCLKLVIFHLAPLPTKDTRF